MQLAQAYEGAGKTDLALKTVTSAERLPGSRNSKALSFKAICLPKQEGRTRPVMC